MTVADPDLQVRGGGGGGGGAGHPDTELRGGSVSKNFFQRGGGTGTPGSSPGAATG